MTASMTASMPLMNAQLHVQAHGMPKSYSPAPTSSPPPAMMEYRAPFSSASGPLISMDNIVNRKGGAQSSLYQGCLILRKRLAVVPGFEPHLAQMDAEEQESGEDTDPVTSMWNMLRRGLPLLTIYNVLKPEAPLVIDTSRFMESKVAKTAIFKFLAACMEHLGFQAKECFLITDLEGTDTNGFVKVLKVVNRVLDRMEQERLLLKPFDTLNADIEAKPQQRTHQENVILELVTTERDYLQHLDTLQQVKNELEHGGTIPGDVVHDIFLNLNALLDFQRRFLIRIEQQNSLPKKLQNWGGLFVQYNSGFRVYEPFIANQSKCNATVLKEWDKIRAVPLSQANQGMVESSAVLIGFLLKPFMRLSKYPLLLDEMRKKSDYDADRVRDLEEGADAMRSVLDNANAAVARIEREKKVTELNNVVDDWKGHNLSHFGELILDGNHTVLKTDKDKENEREYKIYLFERILLCCKEINPNKPKRPLGQKALDKKHRLRLQLKGRIFMQNVTDMCSFPKNGAHHLQIFWKGDPGVENFVIRFPGVEERDKWAHAVEKQRRSFSKNSRDPNTSGTSKTEYISMNGKVLQNPYEGDDYDEDEPRPNNASSSIGGHNFSSSRNASNTSLRSRSTTGGSVQTATTSGPPNPGSGTRQLPHRFPAADQTVPPLKVSTNFLSTTGNPENQFNQSYFSPGADSPSSMSSMRSNSQAGMYPFPRQPGPSNGWPVEGNKHNTAPPMGRLPLKEDETSNGYQMNGRAAQRPPLGGVISSQGHQHPVMLGNRNRSMSSPDVNHLKRHPSGPMQPGVDDVPVPPIPPHMASMRAPVNRSQNNSPTDSLRGLRNDAQSPGINRGHPGYPNYPPQDSSQARGDLRYALGQPSPGINQRLASPPPQVASSPPLAPYVTQLKVKIFFDPQPSHVTIVVPIIIKHRSLVDRIDSKMEKVTSSSIAQGSARLRYVDQEGEFITITNDEDVQLAIEEWIEVNQEDLCKGVLPDFELHWHEIAPGSSNLAI